MGLPITGLSRSSSWCHIQLVLCLIVLFVFIHVFVVVVCCARSKAILASVLRVVVVKDKNVDIKSLCSIFILQLCISFMLYGILYFIMLYIDKFSICSIAKVWIHCCLLIATHYYNMIIYCTASRHFNYTLTRYQLCLLFKLFSVIISHAFVNFLQLKPLPQTPSASYLITNHAYAAGH